MVVEAEAPSGVPVARRGGVLSLLLPDAGETQLLRACLGFGDRARAAWQSWCAAVGDPRRALASDELGAKPLLPLLYESLRGNDLAMNAALRASLAAVTLADQQRERRYRQLFAAAAASLRSAAISYWVLKGTALSVTVYPPQAPRHSHDIDLLVSSADTPAAGRALIAVGFAAAGGGRFVHASGLPVELHAGLFRFPFYAGALGPPTARARLVAVDAEDVPVLAPADQLIQVLGQAASGGGQSLLWVCDAYCLIERSVGLDWDLFVDIAGGARLALPLRVQLDYLAGELGASVPRRVLERLSQAAANADRTARQVALFGVRAGRRGRLRAMLAACGGAAERRALLRWMLFPSAAAIAGSAAAAPAWPWYYAARPLSYALRRSGLGG